MKKIKKVLTKLFADGVKTAIFGLTMAVFCLFLASLINVAGAAWQEPQADPPDGNVAPPINTSEVEQTKQGNLILGNDLTVGHYLTAANAGFGGQLIDPNTGVSSYGVNYGGAFISTDGIGLSANSTNGTAGHFVNNSVSFPAEVYLATVRGNGVGVISSGIMTGGSFSSDTVGIYAEAPMAGYFLGDSYAAYFDSGKVLINDNLIVNSEVGFNGEDPQDEVGISVAGEKAAGDFKGDVKVSNGDLLVGDEEHPQDSIMMYDEARGEYRCIRVDHGRLRLSQRFNDPDLGCPW